MNRRSKNVRKKDCIRNQVACNHGNKAETNLQGVEVPLFETQVERFNAGKDQCI
jgi:hypothetical protein